jgi:O-antigen/teichoic acid export membrane protein
VDSHGAFGIRVIPGAPPVVPVGFPRHPFARACPEFMKRAPESGLVRRNALWNILGLGLPGVIVVFFIPRLIAGMGTDRFGVLTLFLTFLNYFGLFDLGIGRALTQLLAARSHQDKKEEAVLIWTVSAVLGILGVGAALILFAAAPFLTYKLLRIKGSLALETVPALRELALVLPFLLHSLALKGILEAKRRFDLSNMVRVPLVVFTFAAPVLVLPFSNDLRVIVPVMLSGRMLAWLLNVGMVFRILPHLKNMRGWRPGNVGTLLRMGGWFSVSGVVAPIIDGMDRVFISSFLSISLVAYYTTPYELITKLGIISGGIGGVIFPEFAFRLQRNREEASALFIRGVKYLLAILFPFVLVATAYSQEGLTLWLKNPQFAVLSAPVLQWLALFVFITGAALVPLLFLGGAGRPELAARMHLIELPIHAVLLYLFIKFYGIRGAAIACVIRISIDFLGMLFLSGPLLGFRAGTYGKIFLPMGAAIAVLLGFHIPMPPLFKAIFFSCALALYACVSWFFILEQRDKTLILRILKRG